MGVMFWVIFYLFVLDLLGFGGGRVVRWGRGEKVWNWVFCCGSWGCEFR